MGDMNMSKISVIVPIYKTEQYLDRCVKSILAQSFDDFELILVDDGSPDRCPEICDEWAKKDSRIVVIHKENGGLSDARNAGIDWVFANSNSEWITFIDSDDWIVENCLEHLLRIAVESNSKISRCHIVINKNEEFDSTLNDYSVLLPEDAYIYRNCDMSACGKLYKKDLFFCVRYPINRLHEDAFTTYKLLFSVEHVAYSEFPGYVCGENPDSITRIKWSPNRLDELEAYKEQLVFLKTHGFLVVYDRVLLAYCHIIEKQYDEISNCDLSKNKKNYYHKYLKKSLKSILRKRKPQISVKTEARIFEIAYPTRMRIYWYVKALVTKIKKYEKHKN